jgi:hypothetical protein
MDGELTTWLEANRQHLAAAVASVRAALEGLISSRHRGTHEVGRCAVPEDGTRSVPTSSAADITSPPALDKLCAAFGLSEFERDILVLCAGMELDGALAALCAEASGNPQRDYPTFSLALAALTEPHWSALLPSSPLRRWRLIEVGAGETFSASPLRIDERVLHFLAGVSHLDQRLTPLLELVSPPEELSPSQGKAAERLARLWSEVDPGDTPPLVQLGGCDAAARRAIAAAACALVGMRLHALRAADLPPSCADLELLVRLWEREAMLTSSALLIESDQAFGPGEAKGLVPLVERTGGIVVVSGGDLPRDCRRPQVRIEVARPTAAEQRECWRETLGPMAETLNGQLDLVATHFRLNWNSIRTAALRAREQMSSGDDRPLDAILWDECRAVSRSPLADLAQRIEPAATWDDIVLPPQSLAVLRSVAAHVRQRAVVYQKWGFERQGQRGLGISALFCGASGTGKTMAAEVLANELRLDLFRIDLSAIVNKYIGETEKNLRRVFDAAEESGAILLFDEADALFGKRSEVKDAHDRYANIEVSYLLQRIEAYRGLAILTSNMKQAIDGAFLRRIRFVVQFPFPDAAQRMEIWRRIFPAGMPTEGLVLEKLARLNLSGGNIRNLALGAAFLAADAGEPVRMRHLLLAAQTEYAKLEKPLSEAEIGGWT